MAFVMLIFVSAHCKIGMIGTVVTIDIQVVGVIRFSDDHPDITEFVGFNFFAHELGQNVKFNCLTKISFL